MNDQMDISPETQPGVIGTGDVLVPGQDSVDTRGVPRARGMTVAMTAKDFTADSYNMSHSKRGKAIIFNNKTFNPATGMGQRTGTDVDADNMFMILSEIGFEVFIELNRTVGEIESILTKVAKGDHINADCFACVILSHGEEGYVYGTDKMISIDKLVAPFKGDKCPSLTGKPKLFFIQACRGTQLDGGVDVPDAGGVGPQDMDIDSVEIRRIPTEADFLMAYSVVPGFYSWRNSSKGSWFIQALTDVLQENWKRMDLLSMMTKVCKKVAYDFESNASKDFMMFKKQIPCITSMLTRDVYFLPKQ